MLPLGPDRTDPREVCVVEMVIGLAPDDPVGLDVDPHAVTTIARTGNESNAARCEPMRIRVVKCFILSRSFDYSLVSKSLLVHTARGYSTCNLLRL